MDFECHVCQKTYSCIGSRNRHLRECHAIDTNEDTNINSKIFRCLEGCNVSFKFNFELRRHLQLIHKINMNEEERLFPTVEEFNMWLEKIEDDNGYRYSKPNGRKRNSENNWLQFFYCNRSGTAHQINNERKRNLKKQGSDKTGFGCTSYIKVTISEKGNCKVNYSLFHYGHCIELKHIPLSYSTRTEVAKKLASGINSSRILDENRDNISEKFKRTELLVKKDINNIKTSFNIEVNDGVHHKNDSMSYNLFVKQCQQEENNAILFYKPQEISGNIIDKDDFSHNRDYCKEKESVGDMEVCDHLHTHSQTSNTSNVKVNCNTDSDTLIKKIKSQTSLLNIKCSKVNDIGVLSHILKTVTKQCLLASSYTEKTQNLKAAVSPQQIIDFNETNQNKPANKKIEQRPIRCFLTKKITRKRQIHNISLPLKKFH